MINSKTIKEIQNILSSYKEEWEPEHLEDFISDLKDNIEGNYNFLHRLIETLQICFNNDYLASFQEILDTCNDVANKKAFN